MAPEELLRGDRVEYTGEPVTGGLTETGAIGWVTKVEDDLVFAVWGKNGIHGVPADMVRLLGPEVTRVVGEQPNARIWDLLGEELPPLSSGRPRDPYLHEGCHPDIVTRIWNELGPALPVDCRAQAKGKPVLAHPDSDRIIALAHGTAYALWLAPEDVAAADAAGASTRMTWSGGTTTDLADTGGPGWIWGRWYAQEPDWLLRSLAASA